MGIPGLDLNALAQAGLAESTRRADLGSSMLGAGLQSGLNEDQGALDAGMEKQIREQAFARAQALLAEQLSRREQAMREAEAMARMRFEEEQGNLQRGFLAREGGRERHNDTMIATMRRAAELSNGEPNWYEQQRFQTNENIRQAKAIAAMEAAQRQQDREYEAQESEPRESDFGDAAVNPYRGKAIIDSKPGLKMTAAERKRYSAMLKNASYDPATFARMLREDPKHGPRGDSVVLWELLGGA